METQISGPRPVPWIVVCGVLATIALTVYSVMQVNGHERPLAWLLIVASTAMGVRPLRLPKLGAAVTPIHFFILVSLIEFGPLLALAAAAGGVTGAALMPERPMRGVQYVVNLGAMALSTGAALWVAQAVAGPIPPPKEMLLRFIAVATVAFALVNSAIVAFAISKANSLPFRATWWRALRSDAWSQPAGVLLTVGVLMYFDAFALIVLSAVVSTAWAGLRLLRGTEAAA